LLFLTAYFDESGDFDNPNLNFTGMSGFIAPTKVWEKIEDRWNGIIHLPEYDLKKFFHMKHFVHKKGQFKGWDDTKKDGLYELLIAAIVEEGAIPTGCIVSNSAFKSLSARQQAVLRSPYKTALQECIRGACCQAIAFDPETVAMVFAAQKDFGTVKAKGEEFPDNSGDTEKLFYAIKKNIPKLGQYMGMYSSGEMKDSVPLQIADVIAWEMTKEYESIVGSPVRRIRKSYERLMENGGSRPLVKYLGKLQLLSTLKESGCPYLEGLEDFDSDEDEYMRAALIAQSTLNQRRQNGIPKEDKPRWYFEEFQRRFELDS
jgi:hypothetical protein